jgi:hypothetical protein
VQIPSLIGEIMTVTSLRASLSCTFLLMIQSAGIAQTTAAANTKPELANAIADLRHIDRSKLDEAHRRSMTARIQAAWKTIAANGPSGIAALKEELRAVEQAKEKDDYFKLSSAALIWETSRLAEADTIAGIFRTTPLSTNYAYAFFTAFSAARTQDPRALPIMSAVMRDEKMDFFVVQHAMHIVWPLTQEFIWGCYGSKGLPVLAKILDESKSPSELKAAMDTLKYAQYLPALPAIRKLARHEDRGVAGMAIQVLGTFGHPDDFNLIASGLKQKDSPLLFEHVFAAWEFADARMAPLLIPLLEHPNPKVANEAGLTLWHLATPEAMAAMADFAARHPGQPQVRKLQRILDDFQEYAGVSFNEYSSKTPQEKDKIMAAVRAARDKKYQIQPDDKQLTHEQFLEAAAEWKKSHRISGGQYDWVEDRHVMAVATADDLPLLYDVRAAVLARLSDECLTEATILTELIQRIGRTRYQSGTASKPTSKRVPPP